MPAQSSITLNTKVHTPRGTQQGISSWVLASDTTFGGATATLTESVRGPLSDGSFRSRFLYTVPKAADEASACACVGDILGEGKANITIDVPSQYTAAERLDFCLRVQALVANAIFTAAVEDKEGSWS